MDTSGLSPTATEYANLLANEIRDLPEARLKEMLAYLKRGGADK